jgi:hypothetical protein
MHGKEQGKGIANNQQALSIKHLASGSYLLVLDGPSTMYRKSFIKE